MKLSLMITLALGLWTALVAYIFRENGRRLAIQNITNLAQIRSLSLSGKFTRIDLKPCHQTRDYRITEWMKPAAIDQCQQFTISGPGQNGYMYLALADDCGPQFIRALQEAYDAGRVSGAKAATK